MGCWLRPPARFGRSSAHETAHGREAFGWNDPIPFGNPCARALSPPDRPAPPPCGGYPSTSIICIDTKGRYRVDITLAAVCA